MMNTILNFLRDNAGVLIGLIMIMALCYVAITIVASLIMRPVERRSRSAGYDRMISMAAGSTSPHNSPMRFGR